MIAKRIRVMISILVVILFFSGVPTAQSEENVIFQRMNLSITAGRSILTNLNFQPYTLYSIVSDINPINESIIDALIRIRIDSEIHAKTILHRGDTPHRNSTFTPYTNFYTLNITNMGYIPVITMNITITQLGPSITNSFAPEITLWNIILPLVLLIVSPLFLLYSSLIIYRKRMRTLVH